MGYRPQFLQLSDKNTMKKLPLKTVVTFVLLLMSCGKDDVAVRLSLYETDYYHKHYIKMEIRNNTDKDLFIPYFGDYFSVHHKDIDMTGLVRPYVFDDFYTPNLPEIARSDIELDTLEMKGYDNYDKIEEIIFKKEWEQYLIYNNIDSATLSEGDRFYLNSLVDILCVAKYRGGVFVKAGETINRYTSLHSLYCKGTGKLQRDFVVKFRRRSSYEGLVCDTISFYDGNKLATKYPNNIEGYERYDDPIHCDDVIHLRSE